MKPNESILKSLDLVMKSYRDLMNREFNRFKEKTFYDEFGEFDSNTFSGLRNIFFSLATGEKDDFDSFYERFDSPGGNKNNKPVAWETLFIPDMMDEVIWSDKDINGRIEEVKGLYDKCIKLEKEFKKKKKK